MQRDERSVPGPGEVEVLHLLWRGTGGGAERHVYDLAVEMQKRGVASGILYLSSDCGIGEGLRDHGVAHAGLGLPRGYDPRGPFRVAAAVRAFEPRLIHDHVSTPWLRAFLPRRGGTGIVATEHGHLLRPAYTKAGPRLWLERAGARRTDLYIAPSRAIAAAVEGQYRFPADRIRVIPHGIRPLEEPSGSGARTRLRAEFEAREGQILVLFVGRLDETKGVPDLWEAFERAARQREDLLLVVAGAGELASDLARRVRASGLASRVRLAGFRRDAAQLFAAADLFVLPARHEAFGIVLLEAMASGTPILATRTGGIPEIVEDGRTGILVAPRDTAAMGAALLRLAGDPETRHSLGRAGAERLAQCYTLERCVDRTLEAYRWVQSRAR